MWTTPLTNNMSGNFSSVNPFAQNSFNSSFLGNSQGGFGATNGSNSGHTIGSTYLLLVRFINSLVTSTFANSTSFTNPRSFSGNGPSSNSLVGSSSPAFGSPSPFSASANSAFQSSGNSWGAYSGFGSSGLFVLLKPHYLQETLPSAYQLLRVLSGLVPRCTQILQPFPQHQPPLCQLSEVGTHLLLLQVLCFLLLGETLSQLEVHHLLSVCLFILV